MNESTGSLCFGCEGRLNIEVSNVLCVFLNKHAAWFDLRAHQCREQVVCFGAVVERYLQQGAGFGVHGGAPELFGVHFAESLESLDRHAGLGKFLKQTVFFFVRIDKMFLLAVTDTVEGGLGDIDMATVNQLAHVAEEECKDECTDVRSVDIGVGHNHDLVIAYPVGIEIVLNAGAEGGDHGGDFGVGQDFVDTCFLDVEDFSFEREDRLETTVASLFG